MDGDTGGGGGHRADQPGLCPAEKRGSTLAAAGGDAKALIKVRVWRTGIIIMVTGWGLYFLSARFAPISVIQPTLGAGMAVLALFSVFYLKESISRLEWIAFGAMLLGVVLLGLSAGGEEQAAAPAGPTLAGMTVGLLVLCLALYLFSRGGERAGMRADVLLGVVAGILIGLGSLYIKAMFNYLDEGTLSSALARSQLADEMTWRRVIGYGVCLPLVVGGNVLGIAVVQLGFRFGKALVVVPVQQVTNKVVAIVGGMLALGEGLPEDGTRAAMRVMAFVLILFATAALARFGGETVAERMSVEGASPQE